MLECLPGRAWRWRWTARSTESTTFSGNKFCVPHLSKGAAVEDIFSYFFAIRTRTSKYMMNDRKRKKNSEEKQLEKEAAKRLLLDTNLKRVFDLLAGYAIKRSLGEELELISDALKKLSSKLGSERGAHFGAVGKTTMDCRRPDHVNKCSDLLPLLVVSPLFFFFA